MSTIVVMPGGFHPFHAGHASLYQSAVKSFPGAEVYVAATNDQSERPFPFTIKEKLAKLAGVAPGHFVQVKSPFQAKEITQNYDPENDVLIFVRSEKDRTEQPKPGGTKKDGSPSYFQPYTGKDLQPFSKHAYIDYLPTVEFGPGLTSASEIRAMWPKLNDKRKTAMVMSLYPSTQKNPALAANVVKLLDAGMGVEEQALDEGWKGAAIGGALGYHFGNHYAAMLGATLGHLAGELFSKIGKSFSNSVSLINDNMDIITKVTNEIINSTPADKFGFPRFTKQDAAAASWIENVESALYKEINNKLEDELIKKYGKEIAYQIAQKNIHLLINEVGLQLYNYIVDLDKKYKEIANDKDRKEPTFEQELDEGTSKDSTLRAVVNDISEPIASVYNNMLMQAEKYVENHGALDKGFRLIVAGIGGRWTQNMYINKLKNELYDLCKVYPAQTKDLKDFLAGKEKHGVVDMHKSFSIIAKELPVILERLGRHINSPELSKAAKRWEHNREVYKDYVRDNWDSEEIEVTPPVQKQKSNIIGQQNAVVDKIINDVLAKIKPSDAGSIRNTLANVPINNRLNALQKILSDMNMTVNEKMKMGATTEPIEEEKEIDPVKTVIKFYEPIVNDIHKEKIDDYVDKARTLLHKTDDPAVRSKLIDIFKQGKENPYIQGGIITTVGALLAGGLLSSASKMGLSPSQTNILLQAVLNTVIPTLVSRINGKSWVDTLKYTLASAGIGTSIAALTESENQDYLDEK